jgi:adenosylmethionine-8-amino-7-oxononanoate aminotransferase
LGNRYHHPQGNVFYRSLKHPRPKIAYGEGVYLYGESGKRYIDGAGGPFVVNVGHGREEIVTAIAEQARTAAYIHGKMFTSDVLETYSAEFAATLPIDDPRLFYLSSGSEVTEAAIKLARQIQMARGETGRTRIISRHQSYHGMSLGALGVSGRASLREPYADMLPRAIHVSPPYPYRDPRDGAALAAELEMTILELGSETVAAFIAEPISGAGLGACVPPEDYWEAVRAVCDLYNVLLIVDEVFTGLGRTGKWWAIDHWGITPDILITSKGIAGGYFPFAAVAVGRAEVDEIANALGDFNHGGTFSHHAVGAAAALATLRILKDEGLVEQSARQGAHLGDRLRVELGDHPHIGDIRGRGLCWGIEFVLNKTNAHPFPASENVAFRLWEAAFERGLSLYHSSGCVDGINGDVLLIGPPYIITEAQIDVLMAILMETVRTFSFPTG